MRLSAVLLLLTLTMPLAAQYASPVDQAVGDLDLLSTSTRRVEWGLRSNGEQTSLFRLDAKASQALTGRSLGAVNQAPGYMRVAPGFAASMDRVDYLVRESNGPTRLTLNRAPKSDGEFIEIIPPNTVFILSPVNMTTGPDGPQASGVSGGNPYLVDNRVDGRVNGRINRMMDQRLNNRVETQVSFNKPRTGRFRAVGYWRSPAVPNSMLSSRRRLPRRPATKATTPPVKAGSTQSK
jgi:hypothetical protein